MKTSADDDKALPAWRRVGEMPEDVTEWPDDFLAEYIEETYKPSVIPPCAICGATLSIQSIGGGKPTIWACDGWEDDPDNPGRLRFQKGRSPCDAHYAQSHYEDRRQGGSNVVMELLRRWQKNKA